MSSSSTAFALGWVSGRLLHVDSASFSGESLDRGRLSDFCQTGLHVPAYAVRMTAETCRHHAHSLTDPSPYQFAPPIPPATPGAHSGRKLEERRRTVLWGRTASLLAETALAARGLLRLDLSDCDWLSAEHLIRCSGLLAQLQVSARRQQMR